MYTIKRVILLTLLFASHAFAMNLEQSQIACQGVVQRSFSVEDTIFAFDIDEVLLTGREHKIKKWMEGHKEFASKLREFPLDKPMDAVTEKYPELAEQLEEFKGVVIDALPILGTIGIVRDLAAGGYPALAASNMTTSTYLSLIENGKLPTKYFSKDYFFVNTDPSNKKENGKFYQKPDVEYYDHLVGYINKQRNEHHNQPVKKENVIFIDDKIENVEGAKKAGLTAIHFTNPKQLRNELVCLDIL